ncbi:hypothetical protein RND81_03G207700 [Saponaria officinalis]|uniref:Glycosyl transferase CAP10 domain-containing protein n=1 Tax=Saponaria officinalis TaxID=3572 RepID=A0AAW1M9E6_SAPOF
METEMKQSSSRHSSPKLNSNVKTKFWDFFNSESSSSSHSSNNDRYSATTASFWFIFLFICTLVLTRWSDISAFAGSSVPFTFTMSYRNYTDYPKKDAYLLNCSASSLRITCPANYPPATNHDTTSNNETCPEYFRWIHEDLKTWKKQGITKGMVEGLKDVAHFRLIIVNGTAYVKQYQKAYQTRDVYTLWGILQLLKLYPGRLPDLDLMFQCHDQSSVKRTTYGGWMSGFAPPQFHYCADESTYDIVFPDWSYWGWPEVNVKPWVPLEKDLKDGNAMQNWTSRKPYAFWKGNLHTGERMNFKECNSVKDWNAQILDQNWAEEGREGFQNSDLSKQCIYRYKIYLEGNAWSVSEKYILACDSMTLLVNPKYYDFFSRSLIPLKHYWPVNLKHPCNSIKFAVDWGNNNPNKAQEIGRAGSEYIFKNVTIEHVYDYMFHVLNEYSKLLRYRPTVPEGAEELCSERFACSPPWGLETEFKTETMVSGPSKQDPCSLPPPYDPHDLEALRDHNDEIKKMVEMWEMDSS